MKIRPVLSLILAGFLANATAADVTSQPIYLGQPAAADGKTGVSRSTWDMQALDGRIFLGGSTVTNPGANGLFSFNPAAGTFTKEATFQSEAIERLRVISGALYAPASDPTTGDTLKFAARQAGSASWTMVSGGPDLAHVRDMVLVGSDLIGIGNARNPATLPNAFRTTTASGAAFQSVASPNAGAQERNMFQSTITYQGSTYVTSLRFSRVFEQTFENGLLYRYNGIAKYDPVGQNIIYDKPLSISDPNASLDDEDFLPVRAFTTEELATAMRFSSSLEVGGSLIYTLRASSGSATYAEAKYMKSEGIYYKTSLQGAPTEVIFSQAPNAIGEDLLQFGAITLALSNEKIGTNNFTVRVFSTLTIDNNASWGELLSFSSTNRAKSFECLTDSFYFGLGSEFGESTTNAGQIYRLPFAASAIPEPSGWVLLVFGGGWLVIHRHAAKAPRSLRK